MAIPAPTSLATTLDVLADALFFARPLAVRRQRPLVRWVVRRQGLPGSYCDMFAPSDSDLQSGIRLFTGERVTSGAGIRHLLGEEACRVLHDLQLRDPDPAVAGALRRATDGMRARLDEWDRLKRSTGVYCCGTCSAGYWRNLARGLFPRADSRLKEGLSVLASNRQSDGTWRAFPFYFTSLALLEIDPSLTQAAMVHAAPRWERLLPRLRSRSDPLSRRRAALGERFLSALSQ